MGMRVVVVGAYLWSFLLFVLDSINARENMKKTYKIIHIHIFIHTHTKSNR